MHSIVTLADLGDPLSQFWVSILGLIVAGLAIIVNVIMAVRGKKKKRLTYEVVSNTSVINVANDIGENITLLLEGQPVSNVRLYIIKVLNSGNVAIHGHASKGSDDYARYPSFEFASAYPRPVVRAAIHLTGDEQFLEPDPQKRKTQLHDMVEINSSQSVVTLKPPLLNPRQAIYLRVLLEANGPNDTTMTVGGQIIDGEPITQYRPSPARVRLRFVAAGVLIAFVLGLVIPNVLGLSSAFVSGSCAFGSVQMSGSTSFYHTALQEVKNYTVHCPENIAHITVSESSSGQGLTALQNGSLQIANSELSSSSADLEDNQVAAIVFALVINKQVANVSNLTTAQIQKIYSGGVTYWNQLDRTLPHIPIRIIGRDTSSGTHAAFVKYVLHGSGTQLPDNAVVVASSAEVVSTVASTPGAIGYADLGDADPSKVAILDIDQCAPTPPLVERGAYPFWAIEHMYTRRDPDLLTKSLINYIERDLQSGDTFIRVKAIEATVLAAHT